MSGGNVRSRVDCCWRSDVVKQACFLKRILWQAGGPLYAHPASNPPAKPAIDFDTDLPGHKIRSIPRRQASDIVAPQVASAALDSNLQRLTNLHALHITCINAMPFKRRSMATLAQNPEGTPSISSNTQNILLLWWQLRLGNMCPHAEQAATRQNKRKVLTQQASLKQHRPACLLQQVAAIVAGATIHAQPHIHALIPQLAHRANACDSESN